MALAERFFSRNKEIAIVGTGHVLHSSISAVRREIQSFKPELVAIELDMGRFIAISRRAKPRAKGVFVNLLSSLQQRAARTTGVRAGSEMLAAVREARKHNIPVALIDQDIRITLRRALHGMTLREKAKLGWNLLFGAFEAGNKEKLDSIISQKDELMAKFKQELPNLYATLVTERDEYMARAVAQQPFQRILIVVGAAHVTGLRKRLEYRNKGGRLRNIT